MASVLPRSFPNALHVRQHKYETFFNFVSCACPFFQIKLFFVNRLIELRDLSICSTLSCDHTTYILVKTRFRRSGQNDPCWPLRACHNSGRSSVNANLLIRDSLKNAFSEFRAGFRFYTR